MHDGSAYRRAQLSRRTGDRAGRRSSCNGPSGDRTSGTPGTVGQGAR
jgi:hypothetical protein